MLSLTVSTPKSLSLSYSNSFLITHHPLSHHQQKTRLPKTISAAAKPLPPQQQLYQPFRPPPSPLPAQFRSLDTNGRLEILANRFGLWFEYAPLIPTLTQEGFSPSSLEELTGISGVEQNRLLVAAQVRQSLISSKIDPQTLSFFDKGGAEILYEIRLLSASQRVEAARYVVDNNLDGKGAQELARAMKDFPRRRGDRGWENFDYTLPADCLSFMYYRQALEHKNPSEQRTAALEQALGVAVSESARKRISGDLEGRDDSGEVKIDVESRVKVPVVRMRVGEVAEATTVVVFPVVCGAEEVEVAPWECGSKGEFGVVVAEKGWNRWVVLPGWVPLAGLRRGGVVVAFGDARVLPGWVNRRYKEEAILVVADRGGKEVGADDGFYLVAHNGVGGSGSGSLKVERGLQLKEMGVKECLGSVVLVVRPPREETDDPLADEDWE
ncbi:Rubisco accumulation factor 1.2 like [Actinidia chinensis var. chinensis]|uniref:Rubisco accumulation factor 1.2 like n=1 Tax=Actinidia chinensis var. chinensis TaxID=1590841 RepID=A0A2R6PKR7_ACTCC|nr:Rubisco accumulation factor 1.2 like [Actinidia chinensis var. chinensis]